MSIASQITKIKEQLPEQVELIAVSKTKPESDIMEAYTIGHRHFGENKVQDLIAKQESLPNDICWHYIGHLQTNKVKFIAPFIHLVHAVDSEKLLKTLQKEGAKNDRIISCLLQAKIAQEETKFGLNFLQIETLLSTQKEYPNVRIKGIMAMATNTTEKEDIRAEFKELHTFFEKHKTPDFSILSVGMSNDWPLAVEEGSTMIRVGSRIFGARNY